MKKRVAVIFGSQSVEHEVSIITAQQVMRAIDAERYETVPVYIDKQGRWFTGDILFSLESFKHLDFDRLNRIEIVLDPTVPYLFRIPGRGLFGKEQLVFIDVVFPVLHGTFGEDGTVQGLLELAGVPYVGCGVVGSAVGMDKVVMKAVFEQNNLPVVDYLWVSRNRLRKRQPEVLDWIESNLAYPLFVKPANLGSSIGISKATTRSELKFALEVASHYDRKLIVERGIENVQEINCAVMGNEDLVASACEEPLSWETFLTYEDKYLKGVSPKGLKGAHKRVPADISTELTQKIQDLSIRAFRAIDARGTARVDLLVDRDTEAVYVNEINTIPGSLAFHLWQPVGLSPAQVVDNLIQLAFDAFEDKGQTRFSYDTPLLEQADLSQVQKWTTSSA